MANRARQFFTKLSQYSDEVDFYFGSELMGNFCDELGKKYAIKQEAVVGLATDLVIDDFKFNNLNSKAKQLFKFNDIQANSFVADFIGMIIFPINRYLKTVNIVKELQTLGGSTVKYGRYEEMFEDALEDEKINTVYEFIETYEKMIDPEEEARNVIDLLENNLVDVINNSSTEALISLNGGLIYLLYNKKGFKDELFKVLLNSQERLTAKEFIFDGKAYAPSIGNWLRDFIKLNGSDPFDNVVLSKYVTSSPNAVKLDKSERNSLNKLIQLYRNIKFFPESLENIPPEQWEIIPLTDQTKKDSVREKSALGPPKTAEEKTVEQLKKLRDQYGLDSLERKAIEEEIARLNR